MSDIDFNSIDELYPVPGQDNDSQGFRDNFSAIKSGLQTAHSEISALETNTAKINGANDFYGNIVSNAQMLANTEVTVNLSNIIGPEFVNWVNGSYQNLTIAGTNEDEDYLTLTLTGFPSGTGKVAHVRVAVRSDGQERNLVWSAQGGTLRVDTSNWPAGYMVLNAAQHTTVVDFWSSDGGATVYAKVVGTFSPYAGVQ